MHNKDTILACMCIIAILCIGDWIFGKKRCPRCEGTGGDPGIPGTTCFFCGGKGWL